VAAATSLGIDLVGVDLLPVGAGEYVVIELNAAVEFTPEYGAEDVYAAAVSALFRESPDVEPEDEAATAELLA
jgi:glutathione synthase/RimK-type ligase-like ATP-grasp enzyme